MQRIRSAPVYFLQAVKTEEEPQWPRPEAELVVGNAPINSDYTQFWAYPEDAGVDPEPLPEAQVLAAQYPTALPAILIEEKEAHEDHLLELILVKDGFAYLKTESSLSNLEDNLNNLTAEAEQRYGFKAEHFLTTGNVSQVVERALDTLEGAEGRGMEDEPQSVRRRENTLSEENLDEKVGFRQAIHNPPAERSQLRVDHRSVNSASNSKLLLVLPVIILLLAFGGVVAFRGKVISVFKGGASAILKTTPTPNPTPISTPTPTPTPSVDKSAFKVRVLNGTTKTGAAGNLADALKSKGWNVVTRGNADKQNFETSLIRAKKPNQAAASVLANDLKPDYEASVDGNLADSDSADAEVIIGKK